MVALVGAVAHTLEADLGLGQPFAGLVQLSVECGLLLGTFLELGGHVLPGLAVRPQGVVELGATLGDRRRDPLQSARDAFDGG